MEIIFSPNAIEDIQYLKKTNNQVILKRIRLLIDSIQKSPFSGLGKPEPLKNDLKGTWSRRITIKHRLTYEVSTNGINILSVYGHYD